MDLPSSSAVNLRVVWEEAEMQTSVLKRSLVIRGHKTSVSLEDPFWNAMKEIAGLKGMTLSELISQIDTSREHSNLSSAIRLFVLDHYRSRAPICEAAIAKARVSTLA
jgi:predicted DNA-binding ribbon-helix-helix protein